MKKIGLTGGIGSGKTTVAGVFRQLGIPVFEADAEARWLQENDADVIAAMHDLLGDGVFDVYGKPLRHIIAQVVFSDKKLLDGLNAIVHPAVRRHFEKWCARHADHAYILKEAAILFESGGQEGLDGVLLVTAPEDVRMDRVMKRDETSRDAVLKRMAHQWPEEKKRTLANYFIVNDGVQLVLPQVLALHEQLMRG
ncbi:MAG: dephospho-CoA kinase [Bacteroidia bacterium]